MESNNEPKPFAYAFTADLGIKFFEECMKREAVTIEERLAILKELSAQPLSLNEVNDLVNHNKTLVIRKDNSHGNN